MVKKGIPALCLSITIAILVAISGVSSSFAATIAITAPLNHWAFSSPTITVTGTATDTGTGLSKVEVSVDNGPFNLASGTTSWSFITQPLSCGNHIITARVTDNSNNAQSTSISIFDANNTSTGMCK